MAITVSPYLSTPQAAPQPQPAAAATATPKNPSVASSTDSVNLSPAAQQALAGAPSAAEGQKTPLQTVLETILAAVQNPTGPTLNFRSATDSQTGKKFDQSY